MEDLTTMDRALLVEKLVKHTNEYLRMLKTGALFEDYENCKELIARITGEMQRRDQSEERKLSRDH